MTGFAYLLETESGEPLGEHRFAVPNWREGDLVHMGHRALVVVYVKDGEPPVLVVRER